MLVNATYAQAAIYNRILTSARIIRDWFSEMKLIPNNNDKFENYEQCLKRVNWILKDHDKFIDSIIMSWPLFAKFMVIHGELKERDHNFPYASSTNHFINQLISKKDEIKLPEIKVTDPEVQKVIDVFDGEPVSFLNEDVTIKFDDYREPIKVVDNAFEKYARESVEKSKKLNNSDVLVL